MAGEALVTHQVEVPAARQRVQPIDEHILGTLQQSGLADRVHRLLEIALQQVASHPEGHLLQPVGVPVAEVRDIRDVAVLGALKKVLADVPVRLHQRVSHAPLAGGLEVEIVVDHPDVQQQVVLPAQLDLEPRVDLRFRRLVIRGDIKDVGVAHVGDLGQLGRNGPVRQDKRAAVGMEEFTLQVEAGVAHDADRVGEGGY